MGERKLVNKIISPQEMLHALMAGSITIAQAQQMYNGVIPIGDYQGVASILDLDALVKQPLVIAEQQHILGILDGREEDYDLQTIGIVAGEAIGTIHDAQLVVPTGEVWFVNVVRGYVPALPLAGTMTVLYNWYCDLWPDHDVGSPVVGYGQRFFNVAQTGAAPGLHTYDAEFGFMAALWAPDFKQPVLRLPGGTTLSCRFQSVTAVEALNVTFQLFGFIGKQLVD